MPRWLFFLAIIAIYELALLLVIFTVRWLSSNRLKLWHLATPILLAANILLALALLNWRSDYSTSFLITLTVLWFYCLSCAVVLGAYKITGSHYSALFKILLPCNFLALTGYAWFNAHSPQVKTYNISINKPLARPLKILVASDLHLDIYIGNKMLDKLYAIVQEQKPDLILMPGDILDFDSKVYTREKMAQNLQRLQAIYGVYGSLGNHEYYGPLSENVAAISQGGINLLQDQATVIDNKFILVGRNDQLDTLRKPLSSILEQMPVNDLPVIVMDHRPIYTDIYDFPVDINVSGHTHNGQVFPANFIVKFMYELAYGYKQVDNHHLFTTSGFGLAVSPFRLGSKSEVFIINVTGQK
ncbi:metallophosphoesterase [Psittacicella hinzii]|uniref:Calcineurin-like phosphoesterase domain-containing protein n=1 Tax=Psittacicella hinzii TaxID=2028575 RepID=A0A3A1YR95_9GAMM|nr:metallophosphoesterase [Psittacicella hinzii]RIY39460.1 hypothetical protein CKF58_02215 [Psittacicella hinzii]